jgi:hypothetical protein
MTTPELIPIRVSLQDAEGDTRCERCAKTLPFGSKAWQDEARSVLACWDDPACKSHIEEYVQLLLDEAEEMIP